MGRITRPAASSGETRRARRRSSGRGGRRRQPAGRQVWGRRRDPGLRGAAPLASTRVPLRLPLPSSGGRRCRPPPSPRGVSAGPRGSSPPGTFLSPSSLGGGETWTNRRPRPSTRISDPVALWVPWVLQGWRLEVTVVLGPNGLHRNPRGDTCSWQGKNSRVRWLLCRAPNALPRRPNPSVDRLLIAHGFPSSELP